MYGQYSTHTVGRRKASDIRDDILADEPDAIDLKRVAHNTMFYHVPAEPGRVGETRIRLHRTDILRFLDDGSIVVSTGGWNTLTTRARINEFGRSRGVRVHTDRGRLVVNGTACLEGATIRPDGVVIPDVTEKDAVAMRKGIDAYMREWEKRGLPSEAAATGDPWVPYESVNADHIADWIEDRYVFRSLLAHAHRHAGVSRKGAAYILHDIDRGGGKLRSGDLSRLRRYVRNKLGFA